MPNYQKKTQGARFLKNEKKRFADADKLKDARDDRDEEATDLSRVKNEFIQWKRQLCALEKEEREEADGMGTIEKIFQCSRPMCSLLPVCVNDKDSDEQESHPRRGPPSRPFARTRSDKPIGSRSRSPNLRKQSGHNNTLPRHNRPSSSIFQTNKIVKCHRTEFFPRKFLVALN